MPKQELICKKPTRILMEDLQYGQLGCIVDNDTHNGDIVTKTFSNYVVVYSKHNVTFKTAFNDCVARSMTVEVLDKETKVVLSN